MVGTFFPFLTTSCPSVKLQCRSLPRINDFQNVAVAPARMQIPKYAIFFLECLISKCCCGTREAQNFELRHYRSTFVTIRIIKKRQGNASQLDSLIFVAERPSSVLAKFHSKYKPFGVPNFVCVYQLFRVVVFPKEKSTFVGPPEFVNFRKFQICCTSQGNTHSLERQRIVRFHIGFTFVARPC